METFAFLKLFFLSISFLISFSFWASFIFLFLIESVVGFPFPWVCSYSRRFETQLHVFTDTQPMKKIWYVEEQKHTPGINKPCWYFCCWISSQYRVRARSGAVPWCGGSYQEALCSWQVWFNRLSTGLPASVCVVGCAFIMTVSVCQTRKTKAEN